MISREQSEQLREQLLQVLAEDASNTERLLSRLQAISEETGIGAHSALLLILTQLAFTEQEARAHWESILTHRHELSLALGRDVGVRVAMIDYFVNVNRRLVHPTLIDVELLDSSEARAGSDSLTGLADEHSFRRAVQTELRRAKRYGQRVSVVVFDLDGFLDLNQQLGKLMCDRLLKETAILLGNKIRDIDIAARPGEDELALALPETDRNGALLVAERFRREVETHFARREAGGEAVALTISAGVASYPDDALDGDTLLSRAAQALYQAKARGKNAVQAWSPERRRFLRFDLAPGRFEVEVLSPDAVRASRPANLSRNGLLFTSPEAVGVGEEIEIRLVDGSAAQEGGRALRVRGRVVRLEELPPPEEREERPQPAPTDPGDRFEIGMAFDSDWLDDEDELLGFLEKAAGGVKPRTS